MNNNKLQVLSELLLNEWCEKLLELQITHIDSPGLHGGLLSPAYGRIEGRCAEAVYPFLYLADKNNDKRYLTAAIKLFNWAEHNVCLPDGSWVNEVSISDWNGVTVNALISLSEAVYRHGHLFEATEYERWIKRVRLSAQWVYKNIDVGFGNINYPIVASYAMVLSGILLNEPKYKQRADYLATKILDFFTEQNTLLFGEGSPYTLKSPKGCYALDLGYNVEESLPALALYSILSGNTKVADVLTRSLKSHLEFMLPDGAWDNSWGTRNYKWTYWGSRNSDGCQPAYALFADKDQRFYEAAYRNTLLLKQCTGNGLLHGGPHNASRGELASVHHTFCHAKALATILDYGIPPNIPNQQIRLPREEEVGIKAFPEIQTCLVSKGKFRATISGYDREYAQNTHASGGTISMLWHELTGPILTASLTEYRLLEATNMQMDKDTESMSLTPRVELKMNDKSYSSERDLRAQIESKELNGSIIFKVESHLVDGEQNHPPTGPIMLNSEYIFENERVSIYISVPNNDIKDGLMFFLPLISKQNEKVAQIKNSYVSIEKELATVFIKSTGMLTFGNITNKRIFNFVPGMEAIPLKIEFNKSKNITLTIDVIPNKYEHSN